MSYVKVSSEWIQFITGVCKRNLNGDKCINCIMYPECNEYQDEADGDE